MIHVWAKMINNKKSFILLISIIGGLISISYFINEYKYVLNKNLVILNNIEQAILNDNIQTYNDKEIHSFEESVSKILDEEDDEYIKAKCHFIMGSLYIQQGNNKEAINSFEEIVDNFRYIKEDRIKIKVYEELSRAYFEESQIKQSEDIFNKLKEMQVDASTNTKEMIIEASLRRVDEIYLYKEESIKLLEDMLVLAKEIEYEHIEDVYFILSQAYWRINEVVESMEAKLKALEIIRGKNIQQEKAYICLDVGVSYLKIGEYKKAQIYLSRILSYNNIPTIKNYALLNLIECYVNLDEYSEAKETISDLEYNIEKIEDTKEKENFTKGLYINKADLETSQGNPKEAIRILSNLEKQYNEIDFYDFEIRFYGEYGDAYYELKDYDKAIYYHKMSESLVIKKDMIYLISMYNKKIYQDYKAMGDKENSILYLEKNKDLQDELIKQKDNQYSQYLINKFESEDKIKKIELLEKSQYNVHRIFRLAIIGIVTLVIFLCYINRQNKEIRRLNKLFRDMSLTDSLTHVNNRRGLDEFLMKNWSLYKEEQITLSFIMIDIDYFKSYNDNYGHQRGDSILTSVASIIKKSCSNEEFVARYGGEEFIVIMTNVNKNKVIELIKSINKNIYDANLTHEYSKVSNRITVSIGATIVNISEGNKYDTYIQIADKALYSAKISGRNTYVFLED